MRWWCNSNHYIRWWHNMEACLLFCLRPSHRDKRPPARLYSYYCSHQALIKYICTNTKYSAALFYHSNQTGIQIVHKSTIQCQVNCSRELQILRRRKSQLLRDVRSTIPAVMVAAANSVLATASSLEAHNCCNAHSLSFLARPPQQFKLLQYLGGMRMIHQGKPFYISYVWLIQRLVNVYLKMSEVLLINHNLILTLKFISFEGWSLVYLKTIRQVGQSTE